MGVFEVIIIGAALAMDAFGATLSIGVNTYVKRRTKILYLLSFSFFQGLFIYIGGSIGYCINNYVVSIPHILGGIILMAVGMFMIRDALGEKEEEIFEKRFMWIIVGVSVSIDAMVVGFTAFNNISGFLILGAYGVLVALLTLFICYVGFIICRYIRKISFFQKYADLLGGIVLVLFSIKMLFFYWI